MPKIQRLDPHLADLIAAGEVVERPASVVKELTENSIDAGATSVTVEIERGGMSFIRVTDNGCGISPADAETAFLRHATSKLRTEYDLEAIGTLGFRGEALAAISAVSRVELLTKTAEEEFGTSVLLDGGTVREKSETGCPNGTTMIVRDLFFNTPARLKFMKRDAAEGAAVTAVMQHVAMSHPEVAFRFLREGKLELQTPGDGSLKSAVYAVLGRDMALGYLPCKQEGEDISVEGFLSRPVCCRGTRGYQHFFVNGRYVKSRTMTAALEEAYANQKMVGKYPGCVLHITAKLNSVDVNVHPTKTEVKFQNDRMLFDAVYWAVKNTLAAETEHPDALPDRKEKPNKPANAAAPAKQDNFFQHMTAEEFRSGRKPDQPKEEAVILQDSSSISVADLSRKQSETAAGSAEKAGSAHNIRRRALSMELLLESAGEEGISLTRRRPPSARCTPPEPQELPRTVQEEEAAPIPAQPERPTPIRHVSPVEPDLTVLYEEPEQEERVTEEAVLTTETVQSREETTPQEQAAPVQPLSPAPAPTQPAEEQTLTAQAPPRTPVQPSDTIQPDHTQEQAELDDLTNHSEANAPLAEALPPKTPDWRIVGEVLNTYIIVEQGDAVLLIDKHAAHERMNFDRLKAQDYRAMSQLLLTPIVYQPDPMERMTLLEHTRLLEEYGFELEEYSNGSLMVRQVPDYLSEDEILPTLSELSGKLMTTGTADPAAARDSLLHTMACKSAIKGGWVSGENELQVVAEAVMSGKVMYCPHGRPVAVTMTKKQIEKQFKRIV